VAIVGARQAAASARTWAEGLARHVAGHGALVVSGGAYGIDAAAHAGALASDGRTVAYLGTAADRIYPRVHAGLFARILEQGGALVAEHPPGASTFKSAHALRNRFIAGHASHVVIAEAALESGSLGTAAYARKLGRRIWVPPTTVGGERAGIERLLRDGVAEVLESPEALTAVAGC